MSAKAISEYTGKELLYKHLTHLPTVATPKAILLTETSNFDIEIKNCEWLANTGKGVIKPDQLIKRRGKHGLVKLGNIASLKQWFEEKKGQTVQVKLFFF